MHTLMGTQKGQECSRSFLPARECAPRNYFRPVTVFCICYALLFPRPLFLRHPRQLRWSSPERARGGRPQASAHSPPHGKQCDLVQISRFRQASVRHVLLRGAPPDLKGIGEFVESGAAELISGKELLAEVRLIGTHEEVSAYSRRQRKCKME